ncbi:MAG: FHA domain-containing protein [Bacteriovoracaceae bacterium]
MIKFQITESPDQEVLSTFEYFHNLIYIGRTTGNLTIQDPQILRSHLLIEVIGGDVIVHPQKDVEHYLLNGKRATTPRKIKNGDVISFGKTTLKVLAFEETPPSSKKNILNEKLNALIEAGSQKLPVIEALSKLSK